MKPSTDHRPSPIGAAHNRLRLWTCALALTTALAPCQPAFAAAPKGKVVQALIAAAQKEFEAGNFDRAGELFVEIWRQDPESRPALYNAARAYQLAGKLDRADELYHELLAIADLDPGLKTKGQTQLGILQGQQGQRKADEADRAEKAGQHAAAAGLWGEAVRYVPAKLLWSLRHARALHASAQWAAALAAYDRYLAATPATAEDRAQVGAWRGEVDLKLHPPAVPAEPTPPTEPAATAQTPPAAPVPGPIAPVGVTKQAQPQPKSLLPMVVLGGGGALAVAGIVTLLIAKGEESDLQAKFPADKKISDITREKALADADRISGHYALGWALTGVGVVGAGVGAWLLASRPAARVTVAPTVGGVLVSGRF